MIFFENILQLLSLRYDLDAFLILMAELKFGLETVTASIFFRLDLDFVMEWMTGRTACS